MDRKAEILALITKDQKGIEIGPWHSPLAAKRDGYRCLALDVFGYDQLVETAKNDPNIPRDSITRIEQVDLVGSATAIQSLVAARGELGTFDYIVSSHNFEHLPNPIKFLRGCGAALRTGGVLSMAIPDKRTCFDYFRPLTTLAAWLEAYHSDLDRPTYSQYFEQGTLDARFQQGDQQLAAFTLGSDPAHIRSISDLEHAYTTWKSRTAAADTSYQDSHCSIMTPSSLKLLIQDAHFLKLSPFTVEHISVTNGNEFYVHLRNVGYLETPPAAAAEFYASRQQLLMAICDELAANSRSGFELHAGRLLVGRRSQCRYLLSRIASDIRKVGSLFVDWARGRR